MRKKTRPCDLGIGDRIKIIKMPGEGVPGYYLDPDTKRVFKKLIARGRSLRIARIDEYGTPWYACRFRMNSGRWEWHDLAVSELDDNWVWVTTRREKLK